MKDIKTKELDKTPKVRNPASKIPKELIRSAALQAKEKSYRLSDTSSSTSQETPSEYATERAVEAGEWAGRKGSSSAFAGSQKLAVKTHEKIRERKRIRAEEGEAKAAVRGREAYEAAQKAQEAAGEAATNGSSVLPATTQEDGRRVPAGQTVEPETCRIKVRPEQKEFLRTGDKKMIKMNFHTVKSSPVSAEKIKTGSVSVLSGQDVLSNRMAKQSAVKAAKSAQATAGTAKTTIRMVSKGAVRAVKGMTTAVKTLVGAIAASGCIAVLMIVIVGVIGGAMFSSGSQSTEPLSQEVQAYTATIQKYANQYGIPEYASSLQAIMMQESGGRGTDPMQSSECPYNTKFPNSPNAITDPDYSIQVGVQYYASCVAEAGCTSPQEMDKLRLSWQGYNCVKRS